MSDADPGTHGIGIDQVDREDSQKVAIATEKTGIKRKNRGNIRKRPTTTDSDEDKGTSDALDAARKSQKLKDAPLAFSTKREAKAETFKFESSGTLQLQNDAGAARQNEIETALDRDNQAIRQRTLQQQQELAAAAGQPSTIPTPAGDTKPSEYKGMTGYKDYRAGFRRENTISSQKASGTHGPLQASSNVRMTVRVDYQPDICKDYKETGYCGFGDSCKFLHDRGDYKQGWEIDRDWEREQKEKALAAWDPDGDEKKKEMKDQQQEDDLPFACLICKNTWDKCVDPVVTKCRHYFCEQCALQHNAKSGKCFACEKPTGGIFNVANDILKKEKRRRERG